MVIQTCELPAQSLLGGYSGGGYTDCFVIETGARISLARYVEAFYTTWLFKLERLVLTLAARPSSDLQAVELAAGRGFAFAAWEVEQRAVDQLLMRDITGRTRSWFMVVPAAGGTRLYFGSAVTAKRYRTTGTASVGPVFRALVGFHGLYSRALLAAARARLQRHAELVNL
ncbi:MAG: hypothetical protein LH632_23560 [Rhodoferax sp.]|nr:hypothetical protein [Rhodoferax sp.]